MSKENKSEKKRFKIWMILTVGLTVLALIGTIIFVIIRNKDGASTNNDGSDSSFVPFIAIWPAVLVPIIARKKNKNIPEKQKMILMLAVSGLVILGILAFTYLMLKNS